MKYKPVRDRYCQNEKCQDHSKFGEGNIIRHSKYKTRQGRRRKNRVIKVERRLIIGTKSKMEQLLLESEDSSTINTSFIERLNLTIRQSFAYLGRQTACHSRHKDMLADNLSLKICYYNFVRLHSALKFGEEIRTPAMQAGLVKNNSAFGKSLLHWR